MAECPQCHAPISPQQSFDSSDTCPECGRMISDADSIPWVDVARVANLAEAGFLSDELVGVGIDARVHQLDEFRAASDRWSSQYLIRVPTESAQDAAELVRQYLYDDNPGRQPVLDAFRFPLNGRSGEPLSWRPIVLVVLASVASFALGQRWSSDQNPPPRRSRQDSLPSVVKAIGRPLMTEPVANQPRFRLSLDERHQTWTLDTDRDNDGVFESSQHFRAIGTAR